jgi:hypothetical protein
LLSCNGFPPKMTHGYPNRVCLVFSACLLGLVLYIPWPDARGPSVAKSLWITLRDLHTSTAASLRGFREFQTRLATPQAGEYVISAPVRQMLAIVRGRGRQVKRFRLSDALSRDPWVAQETVTALWPRTLEPNAHAVFVSNSEPISPDCTPLDRQQDVSLVLCP